MSQLTQTIGFAMGILLGGWVVAEGLLLAVRSLIGTARTRRRFQENRVEFGRRIESAARAARAAKAIPDWDGWRDFRVVAIVDEAFDTKSFYLSPVDGRPLAPYAPGQYLTFSLQPADSVDPVVRCYSLSDFPHEDYYRVTVKLIRPPQGRPDLPAGRGSSFFHRQVHVGDALAVRAPSGTFILDTLANEPVVLIGAGIGITPLLSMLGATIRSGRRRTVFALLGFRNSHEHPFKEHLQKLTEQHRQLNLHVSYTSPHETDLLYKDFNHTGRITIERLREILPSNNFHFYLCGPGPMMESLVPALLDWGVPESHVHYEAFGPASVKRPGKATHTEPCEVRFDRSACTATWDGSHASLLEFGEASGVRLASGCRAGSCGECLTALRSGNVTQLKEPGFTVPPGHCLTCISVPAGPVVLDA
jgi:ferredoxin-NADP reductase